MSDSSTRAVKIYKTLTLQSQSAQYILQYYMMRDVSFCALLHKPTHNSFLYITTTTTQHLLWLGRLATQNRSYGMHARVTTLSQVRYPLKRDHSMILQ